MRAYLTPCSLQASMVAALALLLLCMFAAVPVALAGPRCPSGLLCPDEGWYCCSPSRESCCKNIGTGGPFGRRLRTIEMHPSSQPLLPPTFSIWQGQELLHTTSNSAKRRLAQLDEGDKGAPDTSIETVAQHGSQLSDRQDSVARGDRDAAGNNGLQDPMQLRMGGTRTGRGPVPTRVITEGFYTDRDMERRPGVGGDSRMEGSTKNKVKGPYTRQQELLATGLAVADRNRKASRMAPAGR